MVQFALESSFLEMSGECSVDIFEPVLHVRFFVVSLTVVDCFFIFS